MSPCLVCKLEAVTPLLDLGQQALGNRFLKDAAEAEALFPFVVGQCGQCGLIQIIDPVSPDELRPRFDWITYREQEGHLDHLVETVCQLPGVTPGASVGALSFKDDTTLARFEARGFKSTWRLNPERDLGIKDPCAGLETVQARLTSETAAAIAKTTVRKDILIVRHILEHAHEPHRFAAGLKQLAKPDGYFVFEVPDCSPALDRGDYTMPWEEHISCFTPESFCQSLELLGFSVEQIECYPYTNENSLVAVAKASPSPGKSSTAPTASAKELERRENYARAFPEYRERTARALADCRQRGEKVAVFGAGHLRCAWVNFLGLQDQIEFVVDDHPRKKGLFMPGSRLPILGSNALLEKDIKLCLLTLNPESEAKVIQNNRAFVEHGGVFACIFPGRNNSFPDAA